MRVLQGDMFQRPSPTGRYRAVPPFVVVDVETTGFSYEDRVIEIAILTVDLDGNVLDQYCTLIDPGCRIPANVHKITAADVRDAPSFHHVADTILGHLRRGIVVAHNLGFEERMLLTEFRRLGVSLPTLLGLDSQVLSKHTFGVGRLDEAARCAGVSIGDHHMAQADVVAVAKMLPQLAPACGQLGWTSTPQPFRPVKTDVAVSRSAPVASPVLISRSGMARRSLTPVAASGRTRPTVDMRTRYRCGVCGELGHNARTCRI
jgi:DNA polymerase III epsilon subunit-like protein